MAGNARTVQVNIIGDSSKLSSAVSKAASDTQSAGARIGSAWKNVASGLSGAFGQALEPVMTVFDKLSEGMDSLTEKEKSVGKIMVGVGGAGLAAGTALQAFGSKEQAASQQLGQSFQTIGQNMGDYKDQIEKSVGSMAKFGYTGDQVKSSLAQLVTATRSPKAAFDLMGTAANLAAMRHMSLDSAVQQLIQVVGGRGTRVMAELGLKNTTVAVTASTVTSATKAQASAHAALAKAQQHLIDLEDKDHAKKQLTLADQQALQKAQQAVQAAQDKYAAATQHAQQVQEQFNHPLQASQQNLQAIANVTQGQASAASDTFTGKLRAMRAEVENNVAEIGQKYGPAIQGMSAATSILGGIMETTRGVISKFRMADDAAAISEAAKTVAEGADTTAEAAEAAGAVAVDVASLPLIATIGLIVAAIAGLGIGIYELVTHWKAVWGEIQDVTSSVVNFFENDLFGPLLNWFEEIPGYAQQAGTGLADGIIAGINSIIDGWNWLVGNLKIPGFSVGPIHFGGIDLGSGLQIGHVPYLAQGGIVTGPTLAMLGDNRSGTEAIVPLEKAGQMGFGSGDLVVPVNLSIDGQTFARATARYTRSELLRGTARNARSVGLS